MYEFYLERWLLPVTPSKLQISVKGNNQTVNLVNEGEINILKSAGLTEISFTALLPNIRYPFARYTGVFMGAAVYLDELERLKTRTDAAGRYLPFPFKAVRTLPSGGVLYDTELLVSLEDYKITEDTKAGFEVEVDIKLKQYRPYGTKTVEVVPAGSALQASVTSRRQVQNPPGKAAYTVARGDSLWAIAQKMLGNGARYPEIYAKNQAAIDARNEGTGNTKYTIYPGQVLAIP